MRIFIGEILKLLLLVVCNHTALILKYKMIASDNNLLAIYRTSDSMCNNILNLRMLFLMDKTFFLCRLYNCICHTMWIVFFKACCKSKHFVLISIIKCNYILYFWTSISERSSFIEYNRICLGNLLKELSTLYRYMVLTCFSPISKDKELLMPKPVDQVYVYWLAAKIDHQQADTELYAIDMAMYNQAYKDAIAWWRRHNLPIITATGARWEP